MIEKDILLLEQLKAHDPRALTILDKTYRPWLEIVAMTILQNNVESQEVVQEFFIDFWNKELYRLIHIYTEKSLKNYLFISIKNRCLNFIEKDQVRKRRFHLLLEGLSEDYVRPANRLENEELNERLTNAIGKLSLRQSEIFKLAYLGGKSRKEIAHALNIAEETVKKQIAVALKSLRIYLRNEKNI
jgi:RNA polymerase sigma-70 factor (ECF subfamily)